MNGRMEWSLLALGDERDCKHYGNYTHPFGEPWIYPQRRFTTKLLKTIVASFQVATIGFLHRTHQLVPGPLPWALAVVAPWRLFRHRVCNFLCSTQLGNKRSDWTGFPQDHLCEYFPRVPLPPTPKPRCQTYCCQLLQFLSLLVHSRPCTMVQCDGARFEKLCYIWSDICSVECLGICFYRVSSDDLLFAIEVIDIILQEFNKTTLFK